MKGSIHTSTTHCVFATEGVSYLLCGDYRYPTTMLLTPFQLHTITSQIRVSAKHIIKAPRNKLQLLIWYGLQVINLFTDLQKCRCPRLALLSECGPLGLASKIQRKRAEIRGAINPTNTKLLGHGHRSKTHYTDQRQTIKIEAYIHQFIL